MWLVFIYIFSFSCILSILFVKFFLLFAPRWGFVDHPGHRKIHDKPTPLLGGAAIFLSINVTIIIHIFLHQFGVHSYVAEIIFLDIPKGFLSFSADMPKTSTYFLGGAIIFILGLIDDKVGLSPIVRLVSVTLIAVVIVSISVKPGAFESSHFLGFVIAVLWIVGITNGFNLIDGVNGLCAGNAMLSSMMFLIIAIRGGHQLIGLLLMTFIGAVAGFFIFNFPKGKIFLGSSGSMFIGYTLSVLVMFVSYGTRFGGTNLSLIMPILILSFPLMDTLTVIFVRLKNRQSPFRGDTNHLHHRLRRLRMTDTEVVLLALLVTFAIGINATLLYRARFFQALIILSQALTIFLILLMIIRLKERRVNRRKTPRGTLSVYMNTAKDGPKFFNGFILDLNSKGINFCVLNLETSYMENDFFVNQQIQLEFQPAKKPFAEKPPFLQATGTVTRQEPVEKNALKLALKFDTPLDEN